jgi:hypothetical protein
MSDSHALYPCGHPRTEENTKLKSGGRRRKDGTRGKTARCRACYNAAHLASWHRNKPPHKSVIEERKAKPHYPPGYVDHAKFVDYGICLLQQVPT